MSLKRNTVWNLAGTGLPFLLGVVTIPYLIGHIGLEAFGILTLIWAFIGYFSIFDFGLGRALTQQVAAGLARGDQQGIPELVKAGLLFTAGAGLLGGVLLGALSIPLGYYWLKVSAALQSDTAYCLLIAAAGIPMTTITTGMRGVLEAYDDFRGVNLLRIVLGTANFGLPALSVMLFGPSLTLIVLTLIFARLVVLIAHAMLLRQRLPRWFSSRLELGRLRSLLSFGAWMTLSNLVSPLMVTADRFVISSVLGAAAVAYYTVPFEFLIRILVVPAAVTGALFPRLASASQSDPAAAHRLYRRVLKGVFFIMLGVCTAIAIGSYQGLALWLGTDFARESWLIVVVLSIGILFNGMAQVPYAAVQASGNAKVTAYLHLGEAIVYVPLLFMLLHFFGLLGAALAWTARVGLDLAALVVCEKLYRPQGAAQARDDGAGQHHPLRAKEQP